MLKLLEEGMRGILAVSAQQTDAAVQIAQAVKAMMESFQVSSPPELRDQAEVLNGFADGWDDAWEAEMSRRES